MKDLLASHAISGGALSFHSRMRRKRERIRNSSAPRADRGPEPSRWDKPRPGDRAVTNRLYVLQEAAVVGGSEPDPRLARGGN